MNLQLAHDHGGTETVRPRDLFQHFFNAGLPFQFMLGLDSEQVEGAYSHAHALFNEKRYEDALDIFKYLCFQNHLEARFFVSLGATYQVLDNFEMAVKAYSHATLLDYQNPVPLYNLANCFLATEQWEQAEEALHAAKIWVEGSKAEHLKVRIHTMIQILERRKIMAA